jgi:valyl-tRNA synthetase
MSGTAESPPSRIAELPPQYDVVEVEKRWQKFWEEEEIYAFDADGTGPIFSVDTPPPYVSAAHLHVGHAMSYSQAEFIIRYQRMQGKRIFYPMGFDDNGLPTERFVEKTYNINKKQTTRDAFRKLCLEETAKGATVYEELWRSLGLSVDWRQRYSTIDEHCRRTAQASFIDLLKKGRVYRSEEPVLWDTHFETALAQADLDTLARKGKIHDVQFKAADGQPLVISTTRPELIPACVGLYCHPDDARYAALRGGTAIVPLYGHEVPILTDEDVDPAFGTGLMMVCTFGDGEDVKRWKRDGLALRLVIGRDGRMLESAGKYVGKTVDEARKWIVKDLTQDGALLQSRDIDQNVSISDRSEVPVEFMTAPHWFIRVLDMKDELKARSAQLEWHPEWMKVRLDHWIEGLKYDWNITRQRFYGVPFPVWYCEGCGEVVLADAASLPVDPLEDPCPVAACPACGGSAFKGEPDVMDTWMTSSLTPLVNGNWVGSPGRQGSMELYPMSVRVQAFEIIRTWLFYTVVKSHIHMDGIPWKTVMISGWGLNEQGKKISKRDLEKSTDATGYNRYEPSQVIAKYGADSLRYWATSAMLGQDLRYNENEVKLGRKLLVKLWNASRLLLMYLDVADLSDDMPLAERSITDRWIWHHLNTTLDTATRSLEACEFATAREATDRFFWHHFCDNYLEMVKDRFWSQDVYTDAERRSARVTLAQVYRRLLGMYAIFIPHITEELYHRTFQSVEGAKSLHRTAWPTVDAAALSPAPEGELVLGLLAGVRQQRSALRMRNSQRIQVLTLEVSPEREAEVRAVERDLRAAVRAYHIVYGPAEHESGVTGVRLTVEPAPMEELLDAGAAQAAP